MQTCFATPRSPAQSDATALLAQRRTDLPSVPPHPHLLSAFHHTPCLSRLPQPQSPERWWTPQKIWSSSLNPSLLGAFGLTSKLAGQVQNLVAERANVPIERLLVIFAATPTNFVSPLQSGCYAAAAFA